MIAYRILGIEVCDDDEQIRTAYLDNVRRYPPEKEPECYQIIRRAFEAIETHQQRLEYFLFGNDLQFTPEDYERIVLRPSNTIDKDQWQTLCRIYQESG
jgi:curved DNA-binding protein CbpA